MNFNQLVSGGKVVLGTQNTLRKLRQGKLSKIYVTQNCPNTIKENIQRQAQLSQVEIEILSIPNHELGTQCKKPFSINLLGQLR